MNKVDGLIISAGYSSRMREFKPLKSFQGVPFILSIILKLSTVCQDIKIITGHKVEELKDSLLLWIKHPDAEWHQKFNLPETGRNSLSERLTFIHNVNFNEGMFTSLQLGLAHSALSEWILYHFVDQPHIPLSFYREFINEINPLYQWIQPAYGRKNAHPILLKNDIFTSIINAPENSNLKLISQQNYIRKKFWNCPYPEILQDFDSEKDIPEGEYRDTS
ncbi:MAG: NTP transferase domain-containing protein [Calditrichaeota bacterium]|nr:NTP transferase domain-containing protein [Calditrichota bacterium]